MDKPDDVGSPELTAWNRFEDVAKPLLSVPAEGLREKQAEYEAKKSQRVSRVPRPAQ